jgi:AP2 domain.
MAKITIGERTVRFPNGNFINIDKVYFHNIPHIFEKGTQDRIHLSENERNLYVVKGTNTQLIVLYKDGYKISTIDTDNLEVVKKYNWIYKDDSYGGGIYCTKIKQYLHYYLYDPDGSCRKIDHIDGDRLNNIKSNVKIFGDDDILPKGVYYNKSANVYEARFTFNATTWISETYSVNKYGADGALDRALKQRKYYEKYYASIDQVEYEPTNKKKKDTNDDWI